MPLFRRLIFVRLFARAALCCWPAIFGGIAPAAASYLTIVDNGPTTNRVNIAFLGDGYTAGEINTVYPTHIDAMLDHMFDHGQDPFPRYRNFFNAHRVDVISQESGADAPPLGVFRNTALDATYFTDGVERVLTVNGSKVQQRVANAFGGAGFAPHITLVTVNDTRYGGTGGTYAVYAGGHSQAPELALHEIGHSFGGLADEYGDITGQNPGCFPTNFSDPGEPNVTKSPAGAKWSRWLGYDQPGLGPIGAYEGARYYDCGIFRPTESSKMRSLGRPFDAIAREAFIHEIYRRVDPFDATHPTQGLFINPTLWVDVVDAAVLEVDWYIDGQLLAGFHGAALDVVAQGLTPGVHQVRARAFDATDWVRDSRLDLEQSVTWSFHAALVGDANLDQVVDESDYAIWLANVGATNADWLAGDFNRDGVVSSGDYTLWADNFGGGGEAPLPNPFSVPEPAGAMLAGAGLLVAWMAGAMTRAHRGRVRGMTILLVLLVCRRLLSFVVPQAQNSVSAAPNDRETATRQTPEFPRNWAHSTSRRTFSNFLRIRLQSL